MDNLIKLFTMYVYVLCGGGGGPTQGLPPLFRNLEHLRKFSR